MVGIMKAQTNKIKNKNDPKSIVKVLFVCVKFLRPN